MEFLLYFGKLRKLSEVGSLEAFVLGQLFAPPALFLEGLVLIEFGKGFCVSILKFENFFDQFIRALVISGVGLQFFLRLQQKVEILLFRFNQGLNGVQVFCSNSLRFSMQEIFVQFEEFQKSGEL